MRFFGTQGGDALDAIRLADSQQAVRLDARGGSDRLRGGAQDDLLRGGQGRDTLLGGTGSDTFRGGGGDDTVILGEGAGRVRSVRGDAGTDTLMLRLDAARLADGGVQAELARLDALFAADPGAAFCSKLLGIRGTGIESLEAVPDVVSPIRIERAAAGQGGLRIRGEAAGDLAGWSVAGVGDVNGDGIDDVLIGAKNHEVDRSLANSGAAYVVFGRKSGGVIDLRDVALGEGGFKIQGYRMSETAGAAVAGAGDVNGDGLADLLVGVPAHRGLDESFPGAAYVVFGKADGATVRLGDIAREGTGGFLIRGEARFDQAGIAVAGAGDVDGDGRDDLLVGAVAGDGEADTGGPSGAAYIVYGKADGVAVRLGDVPTGGGFFKIVGERGDDRAGISVAGAGDLNGDGHADYLVGAERNADGRGASPGATYIVLGTPDAVEIDLDAIAAGSGGLKIVGENNADFVGAGVAVGDVNGDGATDVILGAYGFDGAAGTSTGAAYVVFGGDWSGPVLLDAIAAGVGGFRIVGEARFDSAGFAVAAAGDINGDGLTDVLVGAPNGERGSQIDAGAAYVVFGKADGAEIDLAAIAGGFGGFKLTGALAEDAAGLAVAAAGDVNGDGLDDLLVGAPFADALGRIDNGTAYVVYGRAEWLFG